MNRVGIIPYKTIVVDPPWPYNDLISSGSKGWPGFGKRVGTGGRIRGAGNHYDLLSLDELRALPIADWSDLDSHLYLWTTNAFVADAIALAALWHFSYKTLLTWEKPGIGMGHYYRNNTEHVVFATRGGLPSLRHDVPTFFHAPKGEHSAKPDEAYSIFESMSPGPRLDVFARKERRGWDVWGDQVPPLAGIATPDEVFYPAYVRRQKAEARL